MHQTLRSVNVARLLQPAPNQPARRLSWKWVVLIAAIVGGVVVATLLYRSGSSVADHEPLSKSQEAELGYRIGGRVAAIHVQPGQPVERGQVLVTLQDRELTARRDQTKSQVAVARAALKRALEGPSAAELAEGKATLDAARIRVERAQSGPRPEKKRQAQADLEVAKAEQKHAESDFARLERLAIQGSVAPAELDAALAARDRTRHKVIAAKAALDLLESRPEEIAELKAELERAQARYDILQSGPRSENRSAAEAAVSLAEAQLAEAEAALSETVLTAAERCVISEVKVRPGSVVVAGQPVIVAH